MKKLLLLLADGFEEVEALTVIDFLRRKDIICDTCSIKQSEEVTGAHNICIKADKKLTTINNIDIYDGVVIPGGIPGATNLRDNNRVINIVKQLNEQGKLVAAICAGPIVLQRAGIIKNRNITSYPGFEEELDGDYKENIVVQDGNIITARGPATAVYFALKILENLVDKKQVEELRKDILLDMVEKEIKF